MRRLLTLAVLSGGVLCAQSSDNILVQLLQEVQKLRADVAVMGLTAQRSQLVLYRLQLQQQAVARVQMRADQVAQRVQQNERLRADGQTSIRQMETRLETERDPQQRRMLEMQLQSMRPAVERAMAGDPKLQADEADAQRALRDEQLKLQELQNKLDEMEKTLERLVPPQRMQGQ